eukprot:TRINITY_DN1815_c0_g1_i1.p1 TRINITY_DN1815_c0_g1~~TRINITY_DN1815_c0_g1_i1.p1  ORF type:complete len:286 (+),score=50.98 TRINITY_DN1815_c0_g1_i1:210-1067(+)
MTSKARRSSSSSKPAHIKRPLNCFMLFGKEQRPKLRKEHPGLHNSQINAIIGQAWAALTQEEQQVYQRMASEQKRIHQEMYPDYKYRPQRKDSKRAKPKRRTKRQAPQRKSSRSPSPLYEGASSAEVDPNAANESAFASRPATRSQPTPHLAYAPATFEQQSSQGQLHSLLEQLSASMGAITTNSDFTTTITTHSNAQDSSSAEADSLLELDSSTLTSCLDDTSNWATLGTPQSSLDVDSSTLDAAMAWLHGHSSSMISSQTSSAPTMEWNQSTDVDFSVSLMGW